MVYLMVNSLLITLNKFQTLIKKEISVMVEVKYNIKMVRKRI